MFGKIISDRRTERKISIEQFCKECGCSRQTVWNWEHEQVTPEDSAKKRICKILDLPIDIFFDVESS